MADFTDTVAIRGEEYDYDPEAKVVRVYCENCGHANEVEADDAGGEVTFYSFAWENCGHFNSVD